MNQPSGARVPSGKQVRHFGACCKTCACSFQMPLLSDRSCSEFILYGRGIHGFVDGMTEPAWEDICSRLVDQRLMPETPTGERISRLQKVVAALADPLGGQRLASHPMCPHCGSRDVAYGDGAPGELRSLPTVTYAAYQRMTDEWRNRKIAASWKECAVQIPADDLAGKAPAFSEIFAVFRMFGFTASTDIRLGSFAHLFEEGAATPAEVEWVIAYMREKQWLVENQQAGVRPGGRRLTEAGMAAMNEWPSTALTHWNSG